ncbi:EcsC family protein [Rossellomorea sp. BNER]|uniref:EcsC family protein n=1 Tax=Rossellomorea sp. BNER TaxID=2962031 RepID=UPI003AF277A3|nr:EcsC family protein [Rossellomorea sp. BNER]
MTWSDRDEQIWQGVEEWRHTLYEYEANDLENTYVKWLDQAFQSLPEEVQEKFFERIDGWLFHLHSLLQGSQIQNDARERILTTARAFHPDINSVEDLHLLNIDQLHYIAEQHAGRHRLYSFIQGGAVGTGGIVAIGSDLPAMTLINLRSVQLIAITYGFDVQTPFEMMTSLKVFHAATLPARLQAEAWEELMNDLDRKELDYFYSGNDTLTNHSFLEGPLKHMMKATVITMFRKKKWSGIPLISMGIGAGVNYRFTRNITNYAEKFYQYRYLLKKKGE